MSDHDSCCRAAAAAALWKVGLEFTPEGNLKLDMDRLATAARTVQYELAGIEFEPGGTMKVAWSVLHDYFQAYWDPDQHREVWGDE